MRIRNWVLIWLPLFAAVGSVGQVTVAPPSVYVDTEWKPPMGGTTRNVHTSTEFQDALETSVPGDVIVLDAGAKFIGNFNLPSKPNPDKKWIYIESSALNHLPPPGTRINPTADAERMPKIVTPNAKSPITIDPGANHYRLVGLEVTTASNEGCQPNNVPRINCFTYFLVYPPVTPGEAGGLADSITVDRCYVHGSPTQDARQGVNVDGTNFAVIDSYISDIHQSTMDSQAITAYQTPGPIKIVNNYLSATTEDVMFGGAGGHDDPYVPSDIEIRGNHFFKPRSWQAAGVTLPPHAQWSVKNNLEFKSARRVMVTGNIFENNWRSAQIGYSILFTVRSSQSGDIAVVDDITIENNVLVNVDSGFNTLAHDDQCGPKTGYPKCTNQGEEKRIKIDNNLVLLNPSSNGSHNVGLAVAADLTDFVFQHNTVIVGDQSRCFASIYFNTPPRQPWPLVQSSTHNLAILDNALCRQPTGDWGGQGINGLKSYMRDPPPIDPRFHGNIMLLVAGDEPQVWPPKNEVAMSHFAFVDVGHNNYQLVTGKQTKFAGSDALPGVDMTALAAAIKNADSPPGTIKNADSIPGTSDSKERKPAGAETH